MRPIVDIIGQTFGHWRVLALHPERARSGHARWLCCCDCGTTRIVEGASLRSHDTRSCGCLRRERATTHGLSRTRTYCSWTNILQRCRNPRHPRYPDYGGRGISVCAAWASSFESFYADMCSEGEPEPGLSLDRIDNDGPYAPTNCRWTTPLVQAANRRPPRKRGAP